MDYTTLAITKAIIQDQNKNPPPTPGEDAVLSQAISDASRDIDRMVTCAPSGSDNYFESGTLTNDIQNARINSAGEIEAWLHKPNVSSVAAVAWRARPRDPWTDVQPIDIWAADYHLRCFVCLSGRGQVQIKVTYTGGYATDPAGLPGDIRRAASVLAARYFKEGRTGLGDAIGVVELGQMQYTKSVPAEVERLLKIYYRPVPWS